MSTAQDAPARSAAPESAPDEPFVPYPGRIYHGPENIAGIGGHLARWQRAHGMDAEFVTYFDRTPHKNHDRDLALRDRSKLGELWGQVRFFLSAIRRYDLFHFCYGRTLLPANLDLPLLKLLGKKVLMTYCGMDIRLIEVEEARNPYWKHLPAGLQKRKRDRTRRRRMRRQRRWIDLAFAPRDMYANALAELPAEKLDARLWLHNSMDLTAPEAARPESYATKTPPVVVHAPTDPAVKGTEWVLAAVEKLREEGVEFEFRLVQGLPNDEARRIYREEADIVVDQLLLGAFGSLAIEGMLYGKPVVGFVLEELARDHFPDCPIVNATIDTVAERMRWLIEHPEERERLGREGRAFCERWFDRDAIGRRLTEIYRSL